MSRRRAARSAPEERRTAPPAATPFVQGRLADDFWVIGSPVVALAVLAGLWAWPGLSDLSIYAVLFAFVVTGHHLPGWFRAFGEPSVYGRYSARLWTSLLAVPALVILPTAVGLGAAALTVAALFDLWHVAMQQHGFGRIYGAKSGDTAPSSARLDLACILVWYGTAVAWSDPWMQGIARVFRRAGLPVFDLFSPSSWRAVRYALLATSAALLAAYAAGAWERWRESRIATPQKHWLHAIAFSVIAFSYQFPSWYRAQSVQNLFHALQYFFLVWVFGHLSIRRDPATPAAFYRALFRSRRGLLLFAGTIAVYGLLAIALSSSGYRLTGVDAERKAQIIGSIGLASLLLHFYVDSFIWKVRSKPVRTALAIADAPAARETSAVSLLREPAWRGVAHAAGYFGIPMGLVLLLGARGPTGAAGELPGLTQDAALFPRSAIGRGLLGNALLAAGRPGEARRELEAAVALAPSLEGPALMLAGLDRAQGRSGEELAHARLAVRANPRDPEALYALGNALASARLLGEAERTYQKALRQKPNLAGAEENLGVVYKWQGRLDLALPHFQRAYELDSNLSAAVCDLVGALATLGRTEEALSTLSQYRARHPDDRAAADLEEAIRRDRAKGEGPR